MEQKYRLELIGITYNQIESGVYALILQQVGTNRRIPIIIGFPEAQAIECKLQEIKTPRPLTHDILNTILNEFNLKLEYVMIKRLPNGVFAGDLYLTDGQEEKVVDARSSDAIALALRAGAPIYTTEDVIREASFDPSDRKKSFSSSSQTNRPAVKVKVSAGSDISNMSIDQLNEAIARAAEKEDYEEAARLKAELDRRNDKS